MARDLDDLAGVHHDDAVGSLGGREAVGDRDHGAAGGHRGERELDLRLGCRVEARCGLIEDDHRRVGKRDARNPDQLPLAC